MNVWRFKQYVTPNGRPSIDDWRKRLKPQQRADLDGFMRKVARSQEWRVGAEFGWLTDYPGLGELPWTSCKVEHRLVGYFCGVKGFALMIGCTHKSRRYKPENALDLARDNKQRIERGVAALDIYEVI